MLLQIPLFPESASTVSGKVDALYLFLVAVSAFFTILICVLIIGFAIHYRRGSPAPRENPPTSKTLEIAWSVIPFILVMIMFVWGAVVFSEIQSPPPDTIDIDVVGKQWMWKVQHPNGRSEINELHIPVNEAVRLRMISEDVIHSFFVPSFRVKQDVLPGYYTSLWFEPTRTGEFDLFCAEYCGTEHSLMRGRVVVMEAADYAEWLAGETGESIQVAGRRLFEKFRCANCHKTDGSGQGPSLAGRFGQTVPLANGSTVTMDAQYIRNSIRNPGQHVVVGYRSNMPTYQPKQLSEGDILKIIAYIRSLSNNTQNASPTGEQAND